ncbi:MAG: hypothetical protein JWL77_5545 [Chthonomonadaceae bacterium]|nr:hypothetical protein [Chthonomonadaceae bacterium]
MPAIGSPKPTTSRKSIAGQVLFALALLMIARLLWVRTQPERLIGIFAGGYKISGDHLYTFSADNSRIEVESIHEPGFRTLVSKDIDGPFFGPYQHGVLSIEDGNLYYGVVPRLQPPSPRTFMPQQPKSSRGRFLLPPEDLPGTQIAGQTRTRRAQYSGPKEEVRFRQVALQGGAPRETAILQGTSFCLLGSHVFWVRPGVEEAVVVRQGRTSWLETTARSDLMITSLTDGATRCIRHGIYGYTLLTPRQSGITWLEASPFPWPPTLVYAGASDGSVHALGPAGDRTAEENIRELLEFRGRLYWTAATATPRRFRGGSLVLMSSRLDGTDMQEVLKPSDNHFVPVFGPYLYRNALYCCLHPTPRRPGDRTHSFLCRLHPNQSDPIEILRKLPFRVNYSQLDGGYLYLDMVERQGSLWASLTNDGAGETYTNTLFRVPLDH